MVHVFFFICFQAYFISSSDFSYLMGSSLLNSVVFDKPSFNARSDIETADPILECLTKSSCNYYITDDFL